MRAGGCGGVGRPVKQRGALTLWDADLRKLSVLISVAFTRLLALLAVGRWQGSMRKAVNGYVGDGKMGDG